MKALVTTMTSLCCAVVVGVLLHVQFGSEVLSTIGAVAALVTAYVVLEA